MNTILCIGDPHYKTKNEEDTFEMEREIYTHLNTHEYDFIVILGDILDTHYRIHVNPLTRASKFTKKLSTFSPVYLLIGNHDRPNNSDFMSEFHPFPGIIDENITVIHTTQTEIINGKQYTFVPYVPNGRFLEALNYKDDTWKSSNIIFAHQEFKGCAMNFITSIDGDEWTEDLPYVISGHIHDYQQLKSNILYTGTPIQHTFGDTHKKSISIVRDDGQSITHDRVYLNVTLKKSIKIHIGDCENINSVLDTIQSKYSSNKLKVTVIGTNTEIKAFKHEHLQKLKRYVYRVDFDISSYYTTDKGERMIQKYKTKDEMVNDVMLTIIKEDNDQTLYLFNKYFNNQ